MGFEIESIFVPSKSVDLVLDLHEAVPRSRSSIIYDTDYNNKTITIAQPGSPLSPKTRFDTLHLTTTLPGRLQRIRVGLLCQPEKYIENYPLAGKNTTAKAVILRYQLPVIETNIRSAFRLFTNSRHLIKAKLLFRGVEYLTAKDFRIRDISFAGAGILIPKKIQEAQPHPLADLERHDIIPLGLVLVDKKQEQPVGIFPVKTQVVRITPNYSPAYILAGLKTIQITRDNEALLNKFIHNAQIAELSRLNALRDH